MTNKKKQKSKEINTKTLDFTDNLLPKNWMGIIIIVVFLAISFFKMGFLDYEPSAHDTNQWRSTANVSIEYNENNSDPALWNSNMFSGMPNYLINFPAKYPFINNLIMSINPLINWKLSFLILGAIGAFFLLRYLKLRVLTSTIFALAFSISSHFIALIEMGHNTKFQVIMLLPWLLLSFIYLKDKKNIFALGFFSLALITQLRLNHLQITYYLFLFLGIYWLYELMVAIKEKEYQDFIKFTALLVIGIGISALAVANPHLSNMEYSKYSMRGGDTGLSLEYAQGWSMHPLELVSLIFPNFFGGINQNYWGWMSFTQAYHYAGVIVLILAIFGIILSKKRLTKILAIGAGLAMLMSFGKYFPLLSNTLHNYLPGFNKFRVPATHLVITQLLLIPLAGIGLSEILKKVASDKFAKIMKISLIVTISLFIINLLAGSSIFSNMQFTSQGEMAQYQQYLNNPQFQTHLNTIKAERLTLTVNSVRNGLFFIAVTFALLFFYTKKMLAKNLFILLIALLTISDLMIVNSTYFQTLYPRKKTKELAMNNIDKYLKNREADGTYRVFTFDNINDVSWASHLQIIGGYHGAKLLRYNDVLNYAMNLTTINMLNAKYFITKENIGDRPLATTMKNGSVVGLYGNPDSLERAWFVRSLKVIDSSDQRLAYMNSNQFRPRQEAIVERDLGLSQDLGQGNIVQIPQTDYLHRVEFQISDLNQSGFMVVSEVYYPAGWQAYVDGVESEIYPVNHILRGLKIPAGTKKVELVFAPASYSLSTKLSLTGILLSSILFLWGLYFDIYRKRKALA